MGLIKIIFLLLIISAIAFLSACSEPMVSSNTDQKTLAVSVQVQNLAGRWGTSIEITQEEFQTPLANILNAHLNPLPQGEHLITWETRRYQPQWNINASLSHRPVEGENWTSNTPFDPNTTVWAAQTYTQSGVNAAYVIWQVLDPEVVTTTHETYVSRFSPKTGWGPAIKLGKLNKPAYIQKNKPGHHLNPQYDYGHLILDSQGDATLIWPTYFDGVPIALHARRFDGSNHLSVMATQPLFNDPEQPPKLIADLDGFTDAQGVTHVYRVMKTGSYSVEDSALDAIALQHSKFDPNQGWSADETIVFGRLSQGFAVTPHGVTVINVPNSDDFAVLVLTWVNNLATNELYTGVYLNRFVNGTWLPLEEVAKYPLVGTFDAIVAVNAIGQAVVLWAELDTTNSMMNILARTFSTVDGLGPIQTVAQRASSLTAFAAMGGFSATINNNGMMAVTWTEYDPASYASQSYAVLHEPTVGWGEVVSIITQPDTHPLAALPQLAINDKDTIGVLWITAANSRTGNNIKTIMYKEHTPPAVANVPAQQPSLLNREITTKKVTPKTSSSPITAKAIVLPTTTATWTKPVVAWQLQRQQLMHKLASPPLLYDGNAHLYFSVFANITDQSTEPYQSSYTAEFLSFDGDSDTWISQSQFISPPPPTPPPSPFMPPIPIAEPLPPPPPPFARAENITDYVTIIATGTTGNIYSAWIENNTLNVSALQWPAEWSTPQSITTEVAVFYLLDDTQGSAFLVWQTTADLLTLNVSQITILPEGKWDIQPAVTTTVPEGQFADKPLINPAGELAVLWLVKNPAPTLQLLLLTANGRWNTPATPQTMAGLDPGLTLLSATTDNHWIVVSQRLPERQLMATRFTIQQTWDDWISADNNTGQIDAVMGLPRLVNNRQGDVMLLWVEETRDPQGVIHQIYTSEYSSTPSGTVWSPPALVSGTEHLTAHQTPNLFLNDEGRAVVVWASHTQRRNTMETLVGYPTLLSLVLVNKYMPETGWLTQPEIVAMKKEAFSPAIAPSVMLLPNDKIVVIWKGLLLDPFGNAIGRDWFGVFSATSSFNGIR